MTENAARQEEGCLGAFAAILLLFLAETLATPLRMLRQAVVRVVTPEGWLYWVPLTTLIPLLFAIAAKPKILFFSRWRPEVKAILIGGVTALLIQAVPLFFVCDPLQYFGTPTWKIVVAVAILIPPVEEM